MIRSSLVNSISSRSRRLCEPSGASTGPSGGVTDSDLWSVRRRASWRGSTGVQDDDVNATDRPSSFNRLFVSSLPRVMRNSAREGSLGSSTPRFEHRKREASTVSPEPITSERACPRAAPIVSLIVARLSPSASNDACAHHVLMARRIEWGSGPPLTSELPVQTPCVWSDVRRVWQRASAKRRGSHMNIDTVNEQADERIRAARTELRDATETAVRLVLDRCQVTERHREPKQSATDVPR